MKVLFHSNQLGLRGTEVALYDYALFNRALLGHESEIVTRKDAPWSHPAAIEKFRKEFTIHFYEDLAELDGIAERAKADVFYAQKSGENDGVFCSSVKSCMHAVFLHHDPHGDVYAYISQWLSQELTGGRAPWVPYMLNNPSVDTDLRQELGIPRSALVFGRHGGADTFDLPFVHKAVHQVARRRRDVYFLFMNTDPLKRPFLMGDRRNIVYLESTADLERKVAFVNTCDAMLHARERGETFGLAVAEFSARNKPVITYRHSRERAHIEVLGDTGLYYGDRRELVDLLMDFKPDPSRSFDRYSETYAPENVMKRFDEVFLR